MPKYKQAILVRMDLNMSTGKVAAQCAHAAVEACMRVQRHDNILKTKVFDDWHRSGGKKVVLRVAGKDELFKYKASAEKRSITVAAIKDAGMTELPPGTYTTLALGPDTEERINMIVSSLAPL